MALGKFWHFQERHRTEVMAMRRLQRLVVVPELSDVEKSRCSIGRLMRATFQWPCRPENRRPFQSSFCNQILFPSHLLRAIPTLVAVSAIASTNAPRSRDAPRTG